jgi:hypothetical protein
VKKLPKFGAPSDRPLAVLLRFFSRIIAFLKRRPSAPSDGALPAAASDSGAAASGATVN